MNTNQKNETLYKISEESRVLAKKARRELEQDSKTSVICPKCKLHPTLTITQDNTRSNVRCDCGYIMSGEIYF